MRVRAITDADIHRLINDNHTARRRELPAMPARDVLDQLADGTLTRDLNRPGARGWTWWLVLFAVAGWLLIAAAGVGVLTLWLAVTG